MTQARPDRFVAVLFIIAAGSLVVTPACTRQQEPATVQRDKAPPKQAPVVAKPPAHQTNGQFKTNAGEAHVGWLVANVAGAIATPSQYCLDDGSLYKGAPYRLGRINVFVPATVSSQLLNGPVIIYGRRSMGLASKITRLGPCPPPPNSDEQPQLRSDGVADEADWRGHTTKLRLAKTDYIEAVAVYALPLVKAGPVRGTSKQLVLTNLFDRPLASSTKFSLYYEGGRKKPMPRFDAQAIANLAPGASKTFTVTVPAKTAPRRKSGGGHYAFRGYQIKGNLGDVRIDLLVTLP